MARRKIKLQDLKFMNYSGKVTDAGAVLSVRCSTAFDQIVADQFGAKDTFFEPDGSQRTAVHDWNLTHSDTGNIIHFGTPKQMQLGKEKQAPDALSIRTLKIHSFRVTREKVHSTMNMLFTVQLDDEENRMVDFIRAILRQPIDATIEPAKQEEAEAARKQMSLLTVGEKKKKAGDSQADGESADGKGAPSGKD